jgi:hypothetical protein
LEVIKHLETVSKANEGNLASEWIQKWDWALHVEGSEGGQLKGSDVP